MKKTYPMIDGIPVYCSHDKIVELSELKPNPENPNQHPQEQIEMLARIIMGNGWRDRITVSNRSGLIVKGHGRYMAAVKAGLSKAPVDFQDYDSEADEVRDLIADNKISELSEIDDKVAADLIRGLENFSVDNSSDFSVFGLLDDEVHTLFPELAPDDSADDDIPEVDEVEVKTKTGDLYLLGKHRILCGDATKTEDVERLMDGKKADMVFTDPPYGVDYDGGHFHSGDVKIKRARKKITHDNDCQIYYEFLPTILPFVDGPLYLWFAGSRGYNVYNAVTKNNCEIHALIIWHKINATYAAMNAQYKQRHEPCLYLKPKGSNLRWCGKSTESTLWELKRDPQNTMHPTQKPVELSLKAIQNHKADIICDFFLGSGSTLIACEKTNQICYGMEIDPHYCDVIVKRWEDYTGKTATTG